MDNEREVQLERLIQKARNALYSMKRPDVAIELANQMLSQDPNICEAYSILSEAYFRKRLFVESYHVAKQWLKLEPENPYALWMCGSSLNATGDFTGGSKYLKRAVQLIPNNARLMYVYGMNKLKLREFDIGKNYLLKAIELDPMEPDYFNGLGFYFDYVKQYDAAERNFAKSLKMDPGNPVYLNDYGRILILHTNCLKEALSLFKKAVTTDPDDPIYRSNYKQALKANNPIYHFLFWRRNKIRFIVLWIIWSILLLVFAPSGIIKVFLFIFGGILFPILIIILINLIAGREPQKKKKSKL